MKLLKILGLTLMIILLVGVIVLLEGDIPSDVVDARYASPASQYLDLGKHGRIHYRDEGHRRNQPVVLLHGSNASLHTWEPWVARLRDDYRLITIDLPGHGLTGAVKSRDYSVDSYVDVVSAIVAELDIGQFVIGGNSMGGGIAWRYTLANPEQIQGLVLVNSSGLPSWYEERDTESSVWIFRLLQQPWFRSFAVKLDTYQMVVQGLTVAYNYSPVVNEQLIQRYYELNMRQGTRQATIDRFSQFPVDEDHVLSEIEVPTLVMWGKEDSLIPFEEAARFEKAISNTTTAYYDDVGHIPNEEIPDQSKEDLLAFLQTIESENSGGDAR
jgi:pimeloyl-ACP methyl ester carboxylesterase